ncbi:MULTISPECIES: SURF1 family protein [unclassified Ornithinimicrobium]|uniref:SURF1 family cytochrome oxidase biogenesis protein n=1 Tax=unclassified Ornithinimicrobium TaxID=2615080 RepID=UPI0038527401
MLGVLRRPRWIAYLLLAVLFGVATANLGLWQYHRHEEKVERRDLVEANYDRAAVPLSEVLDGATDELEPDEEWRRVSATGTYDAEAQHLVRNRPHQSVYGYEVLIPLVLDDGSVLAVNRGWVRNAETAATLPDVPGPPVGPVTVTGWLRPSEPDLGRDLPDGQLASIDLPELAEATGHNLVDAYLVMETEAPPAERPAVLDRPDTSLGSHFAYALQWWLTVPVGLILVLVMARQLAREESGATRGSTTRASASRPSRPKKVRIWDEEDE